MSCAILCLNVHEKYRAQSVSSLRYLHLKKKSETELKACGFKQEDSPENLRTLSCFVWFKKTFCSSLCVFLVFTISLKMHARPSTRGRTFNLISASFLQLWVGLSCYGRSFQTRLFVVILPGERVAHMRTWWEAQNPGEISPRELAPFLKERNPFGFPLRLRYLPLSLKRVQNEIAP